MKRKNAAIGHYLQFLLLYGGLCLMILIVAGAVILFNIDKIKDALIILIVPAAVFTFFLPFILYNLIQMIYYRNVEFIDIQKTKIIDCDTDVINCGRLGKYPSYGFYVKVEQNGKKRTVLTRHASDKIDGLINRTIEVGYNPKRNEWIVLE